jgi:hypothetical protein
VRGYESSRTCAGALARMVGEGRKQHFFDVLNRYPATFARRNQFQVPRGDLRFPETWRPDEARREAWLDVSHNEEQVGGDDQNHEIG